MKTEPVSIERNSLSAGTPERKTSSLEEEVELNTELRRQKRNSLDFSQDKKKYQNLY